MAVLALPTRRQTILRVPAERFSASTWARQLGASKPRVFETLTSSPCVASRRVACVAWRASISPRMHSAAPGGKPPPSDPLKENTTRA